MMSAMVGSFPALTLSAVFAAARSSYFVISCSYLVIESDIFNM